MRTQNKLLALIAAGAFVSATGAQANLITGSLWEGIADTGAGADAVAANIPARSADVTFTVNSPLNFDSRGTVPGTYPDGHGGYYDSYYTIGSWLGTGGATGVSYQNSTHSTDTMNDTILEFTGQVSLTSGDTFNIAHDDGLTLIINGINVTPGAEGPTSPTVTPVTWSGATGTFDFTLIYAEVQGAPAVLNVDLPLTAVPEPSSCLAGALLVLPFGASALRKMRRKRLA